MTYSDLVDLLGEATAALLVERLGGAPVYVPACPSHGSPLVLALGHAAAARLCDACAGQTLELPSRHAAAARARRRQVLYDLARGLSAVEVARRHGLSVRHVRNLRRDQEPAHA
jgi:DNA-binding NarL/FixJ family response regulator